MAKKRMFSLDIVDDDVFLSMPISAQALYYHLGMRADDDGFITPLKVMRSVGANQDDLRILITKRYILAFDSGVVVVKAWHVNNTIRQDRYIKTTYQHEFEQLTSNEWGSYTEKDKITTKVEELTDITESAENLGKPNGNQMATQYSIEEISIGKVSIEEISNKGDKSPRVDIDELFNYWLEKTGIAIQGGKQKNRYACSNLLKKYGLDGVKQLVDGVAKAQDDRYAPRISDFSSLQTKLNDLLLWGKKKGITNDQRAVDLTK